MNITVEEALAEPVHNSDTPMRCHDAHVLELRGGDFDLKIGVGEVGKDMIFPVSHEGEDVIVVA